MPTLQATISNNYKNRGFTLVELLIVMVIIGLGFISISPNLATLTVTGNKTENFFNDLIQSQMAQARELGRAVAVKGTLGSSDMLTEDRKTLTIPGAVIQRARLNGTITSTGTSYYIYFYPDGVFDEFELETDDDKTITGVPITQLAVIK